MSTVKPTAPRRRNRKRKRRLASSSESSSDSSDSSSDDTSKKTPAKKAPLKKQATPSLVESSSSPSLSSSSLSSSDSENEDKTSHVGEPAIALISSAKSRRDDSGHPVPTPRPRSPSPTPPPADAPPFLPPEGSSSRAQDEQALRDRFRQFWMASVADAFGDDLEQIRQVRPQSSKSNTFHTYLNSRLSHMYEGTEYDQITPSSVD